MSVGQERDIINRTAVDFRDDNTPVFENSISPKLVQEDGGVRLEFDPIVVTRLGGTLPWDRDSVQLQCGETVSSSNGDLNIRLNYESVCTHSQFKILQQMRSGTGSVKLISSAYTGPIEFDELKFDRVVDANGAVIRGEGLVDEPIYEVQLQSKEDNENSSSSL